MESNNNNAPDADWKGFAQETLVKGTGKPDAILSREQCDVLHSLLNKKKNTLYVDKTGGGKSASYFIATKFLRNQNKKFGLSVVISPLIALANDQLENAIKFGLKPAVINGTVDMSDRKKIYQAIKKNSIDILFVTPEMFTNSQDLYKNIMQFQRNYEPDESDAWTDISLFVIDEVHCVSDWGHDFRPAYLQGLRDLVKNFPWASNALKLGTSATVPKRVEHDLRKVLGENWEVVRGNLLRSNLSIRVISTEAQLSDKGDWLVKLFKKNADKNALVFVDEKQHTTTLVDTLKRNGINATAYHRDVDNDLKKQIEIDFKSGKIKILISTIALAMGFDKKDIHFVIHTYTPPSPVQYYQEIGRAGRDLPEATAYLLYKTPWNKDTAREVALARILELIGKPGGISTKSDLISFVVTKNVKSENAEEAIKYGETKGYLEVKQENIIFKRGPSEQESADRLQNVTDRKNEILFMKKLLNVNDPSAKCIWGQLLYFLGQEGTDTCNKKCAVCRPQASDIRMVQRSVVYKRFTVDLQIPVYGFELNSTKRGEPDLDKIKEMLIEYEGIIAADPPAWAITYIPDSTKNNKKECMEIAEELKLEMFEYLTPVDGYSMTTANTEEFRNKVICAKFPNKAFDMKAVSKKNIIIYDDAMKSGKTIDACLKPIMLNDKTRKVIAIVNNMWVGKGLPEHVVLEL